MDILIGDGHPFEAKAGELGHGVEVDVRNQQVTVFVHADAVFLNFLPALANALGLEQAKVGELAAEYMRHSKP